MTCPNCERMRFVPGHSECPQCGFYLVKSVIHPDGISPDMSTPEQCPNDGTEMMGVTWMKHSQNQQAGQEKLMERIQLLEFQLYTASQPSPAVQRLVDLMESLEEDISDGTFDKNNNRAEYLELMRLALLAYEEERKKV